MPNLTCLTFDLIITPLACCIVFFGGIQDGNYLGQAIRYISETSSEDAATILYAEEFNTL